MRNRKSLMTLGVIVLVLFLGVGYAVVSSVYLNIGGIAGVANADLNVEITNAVASTNISGKAVEFSHILSNKNLTSNFTLNGMQLNEIVTITYTVTNNETDVDAELALANGVDLTNTNSDYFDVDYEITDSETDLENDDNTMEVVVRVGLIKTPVAEANSSTTVGLTLTASPKGGDSESGSGTEIEATEIYYNQPYNAVVSADTVASDTATYARNGQAYNITNLYNNVSELQVNAKTLADENNETVKTLVVYDDFTVEIFMDGKLSASYPPSSVAIEGQTINVTDVFEAEISSDFTSITIGEEVYKVNNYGSSLKIGGDHMYTTYVDDTPDRLMSMGVIFNNASTMDVYFNGNLFGESSTKYSTIGNALYLEDGGNSSLYGYVSLDGTQIIRKGECIFEYQGRGNVFYGRAYSTFYYPPDAGQIKLSLVPYKDGSFDVLFDNILMSTMPAGSFDVNNIDISMELFGETMTGFIANDGYDFVSAEEGVVTGYGFILENIREKNIVRNQKYDVYLNGELYGQVEFKSSSDCTYYADSRTLDGKYIASDKAVIVDYYPFVLYYDEATGEFSRSISDGDETESIRIVPIQ